MGYEVKRFECVVDDELMCAICEGVLENPAQIQLCEHIFCVLCLESWFQKGKMTCPLDRDTISRDDLKTPRIVTNLLAKLTLKCEFQPFGCPSVVRLESVANHQSLCDFNPDKEFVCERGCGKILARSELKQHNCMEQLHRLVRDQSGLISQQRQEIDELKTELAANKANQQSLEEQIRGVLQIVANLEVRLAIDRKQSAKLKNSLMKCAKEVKHIFSDIGGDSETPAANRESKTVYIQFKDSRIPAQTNHRIADIKLEIMRTYGLRNGRLQLYNGAKELDDDKTLADYGLDESPDPKLSLRLSDEVQVFVKIRVMNSKDNIKHPFPDLLPKTIALTADRNETVGQLKASVKLIHNIEIEDVVLTFGTVTLEDQHSLTYYGISDGSFINYYAHL